MIHPFLANPKKSLYLIDCRVEGNILFYGIGVFLPNLSPEQKLMSTPDNTVNIVLTSEEIAAKTLIRFNGELQING
jgi:hypothetical protein